MKVVMTLTDKPDGTVGIELIGAGKASELMKSPAMELAMSVVRNTRDFHLGNFFIDEVEEVGND